MSEIEKIQDAIIEVTMGEYIAESLCAQSIDVIVQALQEKAERGKRMQWLDDMNNPLEPIKVQAALESEILKYNYRKEHKPDSISPLDYTIIYALNKVLEDELKGGAE